MLVLMACGTAQMRSPSLPFTFHDNFWLNLHHFVRAAGRGLPATAALSPDERAAWDAGVAFYAASYSKRDLLFDDGMVAIKRELRKCEGSANLDCASIDPDLKATLTRIAPIYRQYWWPEQYAANERWISAVQPLVYKYGAPLIRRIAAAYEVEWPSEPIPIDLSVAAGAVGAYTTSPPTHTTLGPDDPGYQGPASLEMLFHETSHAWGRKLQLAIVHAEEAHNQKVPPQLWHAVLFYNAGELTRRAYQANGIAYTEYALKKNIYNDLCGEGCRDRVAAAWDRHLSGTASMDEALDALVSAWPSTPSSSSSR